MKSLTNGGIPYTMIYRVSSACIEYPAAILESGNLFSKFFRIFVS